MVAAGAAVLAPFQASGVTRAKGAELAVVSGDSHARSCVFCGGCVGFARAAVRSGGNAGERHVSDSHEQSSRSTTARTSCNRPRSHYATRARA